MEEEDEEDEDGFFEVEYDESQVADGLASQWIDLNTCMFVQICICVVVFVCGNLINIYA